VTPIFKTELHEESVELFSRRVIFPHHAGECTKKYCRFEFFYHPKIKKKDNIFSYAAFKQKLQKKHFDKFYREVRPAAEKPFEINDTIVVFIIVIAVIGIFAAVLQ